MSRASRIDAYILNNNKNRVILNNIIYNIDACIY